MPSEPTTIDFSADISLADLRAVAIGECDASVGAAGLAKMAASTALLRAFASEGRRIYGVTTGYGPLARFDVVPGLGAQLQYNLVMHLATGVGAPYTIAHTRAIMAARLRTLAVGYSAVSERVVALLVTLLNARITPVVPEMGTVGASGDLTPLAHIARALIGEGDVVVDGRERPARDALRAAGIAPLELDGKDGIALVNGTAAMTGVSALSGCDARTAADLALRLGFAYAEIFEGRAEAFDARLGSVRRHPGQIEVHRKLAALAGQRSRLEASVQPPPFLAQDADATDVRDRVDAPQDPYSIRCLPQLFGAAYDLIDFHNRTVEIELNAVTDNPIVFAEDRAIVHGGNFFGQHVANAADVLALAVIEIAVHAERAIARMTDALLSAGMPPFLTGGRPGIDSGLMGAQVTATAVVAEMRTLAIPASIQSIATNANNQDVVTMGTIAARKTARLIDLMYYVLAIEAIAIAQAVEFRSDAAFSDATNELVAAIRSHVDPLTVDRSLGDDIAALASFMRMRSWAV